MVTDNNAGRPLDLVCLGEPMVEFNQTEPGLYVQGIGGDTSNCAVSAARQGARVGYITSIGDDPFGDSLIRLWEHEGIDVSSVHRSDRAPTGIYFVTHDEKGHHFNYYRRGSAASMMQPADLSEQSIANASLLHVSAISQAISDSATATVNEAIDVANRYGTLVSYDTNLRLNLWSLERAREVIHQTMRRCPIALPSYDDACALTDESEPDRIVDFYLDLGAEIVVLKLGKQGVRLHCNDERLDIKGFQVNAIDANAAGDTFAGAFLAQFAVSRDAVSAARYANAAAALSTTRSGAVSSIPRRVDVEDFLREIDPGRED